MIRTRIDTYVYILLIGFYNFILYGHPCRKTNILMFPVLPLQHIVELTPTQHTTPPKTTPSSRPYSPLTEKRIGYGCHLDVLIPITDNMTMDLLSICQGSQMVLPELVRIRPAINFKVNQFTYEKKDTESDTRYRK